MPVTLNSVLQVLIFLAIVLLITKPMGLYMYRIFNGERTWLSPVFVPVERFFTGCVASIRRRSRSGRDTSSPCWSSAWLVCCSCISSSAPSSGSQLLQPAGFAQCRAAAGFQHRRQLHDQHQLAELRRRAGHDLPDADGRAGLSPVRLRRDRYRAGGGAGTRARPPQRAARWATSGWI